MKSLSLASLFVLLSLISPTAYSQSRLLVAQKGEQSLAIVDPVSGTVLASVPEGGTTGHEVIASPDGRLAYVPIYGDSGVGKPGTDGSNMVVIDIAVAQSHRQRRLRPRCPPPHAHLRTQRRPALRHHRTRPLHHPHRSQNPQDRRLHPHRPARVAHACALARWPPRLHRQRRPRHRLRPRHEGRKLIAIIPIAGDTQRISISPDDRWVFTADQTKPRLAVIDTAHQQSRPLDPTARPSPTAPHQPPTASSSSSPSPR